MVDARKRNFISLVKNDLKMIDEMNPIKEKIEDDILFPLRNQYLNYDSFSKLLI